MRHLRLCLAVVIMLLMLAGSTSAADPNWPKELVFALRPTESAPEVGRRWAPILEQLSQDLGIPVKQVASTDYRGSIEALRFNKAQIGQLGPKAYVEASNNNYANVEPVVQLQHANGSLGYRSCLIVHTDSDLFNPEDVAGKSFAFNDPNSTSGYLVPMTFFLTETDVRQLGWEAREQDPRHGGYRDRRAWPGSGRGPAWCQRGMELCAKFAV